MLTKLFPELNTEKMSATERRIINKVIDHEVEFRHPLPNDSFYKGAAIRICRKHA